MCKVSLFLFLEKLTDNHGGEYIVLCSFGVSGSVVRYYVKRVNYIYVSDKLLLTA